MGGTEGEGERAWSRLCTECGADVGLDLTTPRSGSEPKPRVGHFTYSMTQVP